MLRYRGVSSFDSGYGLVNRVTKLVFKSRNQAKVRKTGIYFLLPQTIARFSLNSDKSQSLIFTQLAIALARHVCSSYNPM